MKINSFYKLKDSAILIFAFYLISVSLFTSCNENSDENTGDKFFAIEGNPTGLTTGIAGVSQSYVVRSNRSWKIVAQTEGNWVQAFPAEGDDDGIFKINVTANNTFDARTMNFAFIVDGVEQPVLFRVDQDKAIPSLVIAEAAAGKNINQAAQDLKINVKANVTYTYSSDASWLTFKKADVGTLGTDLTFEATANTAVNSIFYTTTGETRYDSWTDAEKAKGWTTSVNPAYKFVALYARTGFVKLGLTSYGGDLISPKLSTLTGTKDLLVKFKAVPYKTAAGTKDDNILNVSIIGPGTISTSKFIIDNWPDYTADPSCTAIWSDILTERSFTITGATSETQIKFLGGDYALSGVGAGKNRIFIDDIKVLIPN